MKLEVTVNVGSVLNTLRKWFEDYEDVKVTVEELAANPKVAEWIIADLEASYCDTFADGLENCDLYELGYEAGHGIEGYNEEEV